MTFMPNSPEARDIASYIHPQTNPRAHQQSGPTIIAKGEGIWVEDSEGKRALDASAGLWCASLGFAANERQHIPIHSRQVEDEGLLACH